MWKDITLTGFADEIAPELSKQIMHLKTLGISFIEMRGVNGKGLVDYTLEEAKEIKNRLDAEGFRLSSVGSPIGKISVYDPFKPHLEKLKHTIEIAHTMAVKNIRVFSFYIPKENKPILYQDQVLEQMGKMVDLASQNEVVLLHENEKGIFGDNADRCKELMKHFYGDHFKAVFDFANFVQVGQDTVEAYDLLSPYIDYVHIKDARKDTGTVVPPGAGDGHLELILNRMKENGYKGFLSLEPHLTDFGGFKALEQGGSLGKGRLSGEAAFTLSYTSLMEILERMKDE